VSYSSGLTTNLAFNYDAANQLTSLTDALGGTGLGWNEFGTLASEDGPWASDTVSCGYNDARLRSSLTLTQPNAAAWTHKRVSHYD
jgi:YD repeat-containing protein